MKSILLLLVSVALTVCVNAETVYTGHFDNIIGPCHGSYNLVENKTVSYSSADDGKDMANTDASSFWGGWESKNNTMYVKDNSFNFVTASTTTVVEAYNNGTASASVSYPLAGDIYIANLRSENKFAVIKILTIDKSYDCTGSANNTGRVSFEYKLIENSAPEIAEIANQSVVKGSSFTSLHLNDYVTDETPDADIVWSTSASADLNVSITSNIATVSVKDSDWIGSASIVFTATDGEGMSTTVAVTFTVGTTSTSNNKAPELTAIPNQSVVKGASFMTIPLGDYVTDETPDDEITWTTFTSADLNVSITNNIATVSVKDADWTGSASVTFTATDALGKSSDIESTFAVTEESDTEAPVKKTIPAVTMNGANATVIDLSKYFTDNSGVMTYTFNASTKLDCSLSGSNLTIGVADESWSGETSVVVTATDPSGNATSSFVEVTVAQAVSTSNASISSVKLFPNPSQEVCTIEISIDEADVVIADMSGSVVLKYKQVEKQQEINVSSFAKGVYNVTITTAEVREMLTLIVK